MIQLEQQVIIAACIGAAFFMLAFWLILSRHYQQKLNTQADSASELNHQLALIEQQLQQAEQRSAEVQQQLLNQQHKWDVERDTLRQQLSDNQTSIGHLSNKAEELERQRQENEQLRVDNNQLKQNLQDITVKFEAQQSGFAQERENFNEKLSLLRDAEKQLTLQFENIANKIFQQKAEDFNKSNEAGINTLISPLKEQIEEFKRQITEQYVNEGQQRASLKTEILTLQQLNKQITEEAAALTNALKGDNKQQGNWGEVVLERILNESGLRNGHEYETQQSLKDEAGKQFKPDVVVHLPNDKDIVIDSKVSLIAHERYVNAEDPQIAKQALAEHVASIKGHIKGLSKKDYQDLSGLRTLDYVLMFIPIESAFINAVEHDPSLITLAMDNQIMLVSPTNLLVALRTINNIWQYEYQNQNAKKIADNAKKMYDKLHGFVSDMEKIGRGIETLGKNYDGAMNKLSSGRGNLIRQAEQFKALGVTPTKSIDKAYLEDQDEADEQIQ